ncbi:copper resistance protein NlpE N-terminal domain-containing protein [Bordetella trematum]|uniref:copper resistance protein NlpE N-terminal domain-containing protein n=1 Tax=Bordetella trematum TaxID=123899 RepID=UPI000D9D48CB|nr:copper resistance protein NlpE N-terminal domain-containing protein [Bordetella trematum]SPU49127.1 lipoprotein [Bordetella trematum]VDH04128.1 Uncharacterised protein [Bordetella trematum]
MPAPVFAPRLRPALLTGTVVTALFMAGCAQQRSEGYYNPPGESTLTDAQSQAQGAGHRSVLHAPSQVQIALKPRQPGGSAAVSSPTSTNNEGVAPPEAGATVAEPAPTPPPGPKALIPQAQTFQGTLPCLTPELNCDAQRITLTLAPNAQWRARIAYLDGHPKADTPTYEQGCWDVLPERPPRVLLLDRQGNLRADLAMPQNNTLRVRSVNGRTPNLNYTLTRQPDLDPIAELKDSPDLRCSR